MKFAAGGATHEETPPFPVMYLQTLYYFLLHEGFSRRRLPYVRKKSFRCPLKADLLVRLSVILQDNQKVLGSGMLLVTVQLLISFSALLDRTPYNFIYEHGCSCNKSFPFQSWCCTEMSALMLNSLSTNLYLVNEEF